MKKAFRFIIVMVILIVAMMATAPSPENHRAMLEEKLEEELIKESENNPGLLNRLAIKATVKLIVSQTGIQDCYVFNLGYLPKKETNEYISIGIFNHVFLLSMPELIVGAQN